MGFDNSSHASILLNLSRHWQVVKDVVLTVNQAIEPVEKGVTKIRDRLHPVSAKSDEDITSNVDLEEHVEDVLSDTPRILIAQ